MLRSFGFDDNITLRRGIMRSMLARMHSFSSSESMWHGWAPSATACAVSEIRKIIIENHDDSAYVRIINGLFVRSLKAVTAAAVKHMAITTVKATVWR